MCTGKNYVLAPTSRDIYEIHLTPFHWTTSPWEGGGKSSERELGRPGRQFEYFKCKNSVSALKNL